jgi:hypothetical protein
MINSLRAAGGRTNDGAKKTKTRDRPRAVPAPEANAELQINIDVCEHTCSLTNSSSVLVFVSLSCFT